METLTLHRSSDALAGMFIVLVLVALPAGGLVMALKRGAAPGLRWFCAAATLAMIVVGVFLIRISTSEFVAVGLSERSLEIRFPTPMPAVSVGVQEISAIWVVQNRQPNRRLWLLVLDRAGAPSYVSYPIGTIDPVLAAAERLAQLTGKPVQWGVRTGRYSAVETAAESDVKP